MGKAGERGQKRVNRNQWLWGKGSLGCARDVGGMGQAQGVCEGDSSGDS